MYGQRNEEAGQTKRPPDMLDKLIDAALRDVTEAEEIAYAGGMRSTVGSELIAAHSSLLRARAARPAPVYREPLRIREDSLSS